LFYSIEELCLSFDDTVLVGHKADEYGKLDVTQSLDFLNDAVLRFFHERV
jgi:hypothetical protein